MRRDGWCWLLALPVVVLSALPCLAQVPGATGQARNPFQLSPQEQAQLDEILGKWETESSKVRSYYSPFERWEYDPVFGPAKGPKTKSEGQLRYAKPDKGMFKITAVQHYVPPSTAGAEPEWKAKEGDFPEHWVCDGKAVYEYDASQKQLKVYPMPPEMQGNAIADGPLPFLFGAERDKLKARYFLRVTGITEKEIWLEARPRQQRDAARFHKVELILDRKEFLPTHLKVYLPNLQSSTLYIFGTATINPPLEPIFRFFQQPSTPVGWKKVVIRPPDGPPPGQAARPGPTRIPQR